MATTEADVVEAMLKIIREVSDGPKEAFFYPMGGPSLRLVTRVLDTMNDYVYVSTVTAKKPERGQ